jgi:EAL domain-containing protein (putative c-di-GMP-specific phosphodiesterase class I)
MLNLEIFIIAHKLGIVPIATMTPFAISPFPIYAYVMTHSIAMSGVAIFAAFIDTIILMPFVKLMDEYDLYVFAKEINNLEKAYKKCEAEERVFDEELLSASLLRTLDTLSDVLRRILKRNVPKRCGDVFFDYQPQMNRDSKFVGAEVLIRWNPLSKISNEKETIYPPLVIYLAYRIGMLRDMDQIIIDNAVAELMYLKSKGHGQVKLDVNLAISSMTPALCEYVNGRMSMAGIDRNRLWITITQNDNIPVNATPENIECMLELKNSGYIVGVDGFDAGAIAFNYLREGFFNSITIGQKITKELSLKGLKANKYIVNMLIDYGQENDTYITANFLEDDSYMVKLAGMGVDFFQGEVLVPPLPVAKFNDFMDIEEKKGLLAYYKDEVI